MASVSISRVKILRLLGYETELQIIFAMILFDFSVSTILKAIYFYCVSEMTRDMKMVSICTQDPKFYRAVLPKAECLSSLCENCPSNRHIKTAAGCS